MNKFNKFFFVWDCFFSLFNLICLIEQLVQNKKDSSTISISAICFLASTAMAFAHYSLFEKKK